MPVMKLQMTLAAAAVVFAMSQDAGAQKVRWFSTTDDAPWKEKIGRAHV